MFFLGVSFHAPECVQTRLEQGIRSRGDEVDADCCVRARGLPWQVRNFELEINL